MSLQPIEGLTPREQKKLEKMMMRELLQQSKDSNKQAKKRKLKQKPMQTSGIEKPPTKRIKRSKSKVSSSNQLNSQISEKPKPENQSPVIRDNNDGQNMSLQKETSKIQENEEQNKPQTQLQSPQNNQHLGVTSKAPNSEESEEKVKQPSVKAEQKKQNSQKEGIEREKSRANQIIEKQKSINTKVSVGYMKPLNKAYNITETQFFQYIMNYSYSTRERIIENADNLAKEIDKIEKIEGQHIPQISDPEVERTYSRLPPMKNIVNEGENIDFSDKRFVEIVHKYFSKDSLAL